jgi:hypothetical protein
MTTEQHIRRFLKHLMISLDHPDMPRDDIVELSARIKRLLHGSSDATEKLFYRTACASLRWASFGGDRQRVIDCAAPLIKLLREQTEDK